MRFTYVLLLWLTILLLTVSDVFAASATLRWTAPGADGMVGQAAQYDIRYATSPITDANWSTATRIITPPIPKPAGNSEIFKIPGLLAGTTYYFALKTADSKPNWSKLSNNAVVTTCTGVCSGTTGNIDGSAGGVVNLADMMLLNSYLSNAGLAALLTICPEEANCDGSADGVINIADLSRMVMFLTAGQPLAKCP
jgi:hypothetical protein